jgi:uncharacterized protein
MRTVRREAVAPPDLGTELIGIPAGADLELDLRLEAVMEGVLVTGQVRGPLAGQCVRCLEDLESEIEVDLQELFVYPERSEQDDDDELREIVDEYVDLEPALRDAVVLALPFQPVCRPDCPGLCSQCGQLLADEPGHRHEEQDPRWEALRVLAQQGDEGGPDGVAEDEKET